MHALAPRTVLLAATIAPWLVGTMVAADQPNIVWITCEDLSPHLGCYGDTLAITPTLDQLASEGVRYTQAFAHTGVCATARSGLVTGMYPSSLGSHHMRCTTTLPSFVKTFPQLLREAGYYTGNVSKTDYNFPVPVGAWSGRRNTAHWRRRDPGQPFLYVHNLNVTHESRVRLPEGEFLKLTARVRPDQRHDPASIVVPPYHPDTPKVRRERARYYDMVTQMDYQVADILKQLDEDGLRDDTIVFFYADHGTGLPRAKQFIFDAGMQVPLIIRFGKNWSHLAPAEPGSTMGQLVSFVDFGPAVLSLVGVDTPHYMQGRPFLGKSAVAPRNYIYGIRDRMDERYDMSRTVRDHRYKYHRNYMPYLPHYPWLDYMDMLETSKEMRRLKAEGKLSGAMAHFMADTKPIEELYDIRADPFELHNLAGSADHQEVLQRLRKAHLAWVRRTVDTGLLPEQYLRDRAIGSSEYEFARSGAYPLERMLETALLMDQGVDALPDFIERLSDRDVGVRFWAANGLTALGSDARPAAGSLVRALDDNSPEVQIAVAQALCRLGRPERALPILAMRLTHHQLYIRVAAANVVDRIGEQARPILPEVRHALAVPYPDLKQGAEFLPWLLEHTLGELER